jgi:hypothetical protein
VTTELEWIMQKRAELRRAKKREFDPRMPHPDTWDQARFIQIIGDRDREIRRLKTKLQVKV